MILQRRLFYTLLCAAALSPLACAGETEAPSEPDHHDDGEGPVGSVSSPLAPSDSVATAIASGTCATSVLNALSLQLIAEIQCMRPNTFTKIDKTPGLALGSSVMPYLQTTAAQALVAAQKARGTTMSINSAMRTLPAQYMLYRFYQTGRCGITLAASPGTSNHEGAIAIDINDNAGWRSVLQSKNFRWLGAKDAVHYDFIGAGTVDLRGLSVKAFQRMWNRNHLTDRIDEDGAYGPATASRLAQAPIGGFAKGADCTKMTPGDAGKDAAPMADAGDEPDAEPGDVPVVPDATEGDGDSGASPLETASDPPAPEGSSGCAVVSEGRVPTGSTVALALGGAAAVVLGARRRRRAAGERTQE